MKRSPYDRFAYPTIGSFLLPWLVMCFLLSYLTDEPVAASNEPVQLRVLTYNLLHDGPWSGFFENGTHLKERLDMTIQELRRLQPDVIAFQEASQSRRHGNVPQRIAEALGYQMVFAPATERIFGISLLDRLIISVMGFKEGPALLSRYPIVASEVYDLPRCRHRLDPRIFAFYCVPRSMPLTDQSKSFLPIRRKGMNASSHELESCSVNIEEQDERS